MLKQYFALLFRKIIILPWIFFYMKSYPTKTFECPKSSSSGPEFDKNMKSVQPPFGGNLFHH